MTIKVTFKSKEYTTLKDITDTRIDLGLEILKPYMRGYFEPIKIEIWSYAPMRELGGIELFRENDFNVGRPYEIREYIDNKLKTIPDDKRILTLSNSIINIIGKWKLDKIEPEGYFSINNAQMWRNVYGDIEMNAYPSKHFEDFIDMFWNDKSLRDEMLDNLFEKFIKNYQKEDDSYKSYKSVMDLNWACFAFGIPSKYEIENFRAAYYSTTRTFIMDVLQEFADSNDWVQKSLKLKYILDRLYEIEDFKRDIKNILDNFKIIEKIGGSIMLTGQSSDSFSNLYKELSDGLLTELFRALPKDNTINNKIKNVVKKQSMLLDNEDE